MVQKELDIAKDILGDKFQVNEYKIKDLVEDRESHGRVYEKCYGSQIQPCIGADGEVYVCTNHRGHRRYSYGNVSERPFGDVWRDISNRNRVMGIIEGENFSKCSDLCKPHESNKAMWYISSIIDDKNKMTRLRQMGEKAKSEIKHAEFI